MMVRSSALLFFLILSLNMSFAQTRGIIPFTGIRYFNEGISIKNIEVRVDGALLLNNRLPVNKEFEIRLVLPEGFTQDRAKMIFVGAELNILSSKADVLSKIPNIFKENETKGFPAASFKEINVKLSLKPEQIKADAGCMLKLRYYDLKGKNQLRVDFPISIARPGEELLTAKLVNEIKTTGTVQAKTVGLKIKTIDFTIDTSIRVAPKMAYASLDIKGIEGTSITEVLSGKESFWVYDADLNEVKITDKQLKQVGGAMENNVVNYLSKIPYRLKTVNNKIYTVRFHWESTDRRKIIDIVVTK